MSDMDGVETLPYPAGKMRLVGIANNTQKICKQAEKALKVAKSLDPCDSIRVMRCAINMIDIGPLLFAPLDRTISLSIFNELCDRPSEDGLQFFIDNLKRDIDDLYRMAQIPGILE